MSENDDQSTVDDDVYDEDEVDGDDEIDGDDDEIESNVQTKVVRVQDVSSNKNKKVSK